MVDFFLEFYCVLGIERATLIGHDLGGWTAATLTLEHSKLVERLVLIDTNPFSTPKSERGTFYRPATRQQTLKHLQQLFYRQDFIDWQLAERVFKQQVAIGDNYAIQQLAQSIYRYEDVLDNRLEQLTTPTLIIQSSEDCFVPSHIGLRFHREIKNSRLEIIDKCGHLPYVEQPKELVQAIESFLSCRGSPIVKEK